MSGIFKLGWKDLLKGLIVVTLASVFYAVIQLLPTFGLSPELQTVIATVLGYLAKNLVTDEDNKLLGKF